VKAVVAKIELGEVDAGVVYRTDIDAAPGRVHGIVLPAVHQVTAECPIAALSTDGRPALAARAFVDFVLGGEGRAVLAGRGFQLP
jgi:molybdate transport system substrate-binding protein